MCQRRTIFPDTIGCRVANTGMISRRFCLAVRTTFRMPSGLVARLALTGSSVICWPRCIPGQQPGRGCKLREYPSEHTGFGEVPPAGSGRGCKAGRETGFNSGTNAGIRPGEWSGSQPGPGKMGQM